MKKILIFLAVMTFMFSFVAANTIESSTMVFEGALTDDGDGSYSGIIALINEDGTSLGDGVTGFDIFAQNGATAIFTDEINPTKYVTISSYDAWPSATWSPDTPDWDSYQLKFDGNDWSLEYVSEGTAHAAPMSGLIDWNARYASETGIGVYYSGSGYEIDDGLGGAQAWDMDWSWGSEYVPLEFEGFDVTIEDLDGTNYRVILTPASENQQIEGTLEDYFWSISVTPNPLSFGTIPRGSNIEDVADNGPIVIDASGSETASDKIYVYASVTGEDVSFYQGLLELLEDNSGSNWKSIASIGVLEISEDGSRDYGARLAGDTSNVVPGSKSATIVYTAYGESISG